MKGQEGNTSQQQQQQQPITIFYGGRVCVCDATEIQVYEINASPPIL